MKLITDHPEMLTCRRGHLFSFWKIVYNILVPHSDSPKFPKHRDHKRPSQLGIPYSLAPTAKFLWQMQLSRYSRILFKFITWFQRWTQMAWQGSQAGSLSPELEVSLKFWPWPDHCFHLVKTKARITLKCSQHQQCSISFLQECQIQNLSASPRPINQLR